MSKACQPASSRSGFPGPVPRDYILATAPVSVLDWRWNAFSSTAPVTVTQHEDIWEHVQLHDNRIAVLII